MVRILYDLGVWCQSTGCLCFLAVGVGGLQAPTPTTNPTQPSSPHPREEEDVNRRLDRKMTDAFAQIWKIHKDKGVPVREIPGRS